MRREVDIVVDVTINRLNHRLVCEAKASGQNTVRSRGPMPHQQAVDYIDKMLNEAAIALPHARTV